MRPGSSLLADFYFCLGFFTRLPFPSAASGSEPHSLANFSRAVRMLPVAGSLVGALAAIAMAAASRFGFPPPLAAPLAICSLVLLGGAMHEDGLADCADGFFGGATRERKLEIMRESQLGTFGAVALVFSLYLRAASLALIADESQGIACAVLIGAAALSRAALLMPLALLPPARENGAGFAAGEPERAALVVAACLAVVFALAPVVAGAYLARSLAGIAAATGAAYAIVLLARKQIGGQTGDVAGAAQQFSEIAYYLAFAAGV
ncbi:MAG TPA: adenosylcobinamide-GDP ribazoletransferase [Methylocella sp.]|jgi:adenosylcobinamide-GDP ribazoletransferase|nr:adenosylcobinamide-GDP ribazoletransferase [Methylocella sp.]